MLICLLFFKYHFDGFRPLSMCFWPYISVFEITGIPASFFLPKIPYRFRFWWKNVKAKVVEFIADRFRPFSSPCDWFGLVVASFISTPLIKLCPWWQNSRRHMKLCASTATKCEQGMPLPLTWLTDEVNEWAARDWLFRFQNVPY